MPALLRPSLLAVVVVVGELDQVAVRGVGQGLVAGEVVVLDAELLARLSVSQPETSRVDISPRYVPHSTHSSLSSHSAW